jgi:hypothetical protein
MARHKSPSPSSKPRWECVDVKLVAAPADPKEWKYLLETLAQELYDLSHQLQGVERSGSTSNLRSYSIAHPSQIETQTPAATVTGEDGVSDGKEHHDVAA